MLSQLYDALCERVWKLDKRIRYASVIDRDGRVLAGGMRRGVRSLEPPSEDLKLIAHIISEMYTWEAWDHYFGKTLYTVIRRELVNLMIFLHGSKFVLVATEPDFPIEGADSIRGILMEFDLSIR